LLSSADDKEWPDRITRSQIEALFEAHKENLSFTKIMLDKFLSREEYQGFILLPPQEQTAIMTSHTLSIAEAMEDDTVEVGDFAGWVVRRASEVLLRTEELAPREGAVKNLVRQLERLSIVDNRMIERGMMVGRGKALFEMADSNKGGTISRNEMQKMMRRFKVPITKGEFGVIWRTEQTNLEALFCCRPCVSRPPLCSAARASHRLPISCHLRLSLSCAVYWLWRYDRCD
jgi:hypothetical protein